MYWRRFTQGWAAAGINYSLTGTGVRISEVRAQYRGLILGGVEENRFPKLTEAELRIQAVSARQQAGKQLLLTPGCSVPDQTSALSVRRLGSVA